MSAHLEKEMKLVREKLFSLTALVEESIQNAVKAIKTKDDSIAKKVVELDNIIDEKEVELEEDILKILALYQPVATDLRYLIGVLKVNNDLERIGDLAVNISERVVALNRYPAIEAPFDITSMAQMTHSMFKRAVDCFVKLDKELANQVAKDDDEIDQINHGMYKIIFKAIKEEPENVEALIQYLAASRNLERIADYCTNIAEDAIYTIEGRIIRHAPYLNA